MYSRRRGSTRLFLCHSKISSTTSLPVSMVSSMTSLPPSRISSIPSPTRLITSPLSPCPDSSSLIELSVSRRDEDSSLFDELSSRFEEGVSASEATAERLVVTAELSSYLPALYSDPFLSPAEQAVTAAAADSAQIVTARYFFICDLSFLFTVSFPLRRTLSHGINIVNEIFIASFSVRRYVITVREQLML